MSDRLTDLEIKLTFLEQTVDQLNGVVIEQDKRIDQLRAEIKRLQDEIDRSQEGPSANEAPPHY